MEQTPFEAGVVSISLGCILFAIRMFFKESWNMKDHSALSWKSFVNSWVLIVLLIIMGFSILFKEF